MRRRHAFLAVTIIAGLLLVSDASPASAATWSLVASADTYVRGGPYADTNYNNSGFQIRVKHGSGGDLIRVGYVRFDLSALQLGTANLAVEARLVLEPFSPDGVATGDYFYVYSLDDGVAAGGGEQGEDWGESTLTFNNAPGLLPDGLPDSSKASSVKNTHFPHEPWSDEWVDAPDLGGGLGNPLDSGSDDGDSDFRWGLIDFLNRDTNGIVTFMIFRAGGSNGNNCCSFYDRESDTNSPKPTLTVETVAHPAPPAPTPGTIVQPRAVYMPREGHTMIYELDSGGDEVCISGCVYGGLNVLRIPVEPFDSNLGTLTDIRFDFSHRFGLTEKAGVTKIGDSNPATVDTEPLYPGALDLDAAGIDSDQGFGEVVQSATVLAPPLGTTIGCTTTTTCLTLNAQSADYPAGPFHMSPAVYPNGIDLVTYTRTSTPAYLQCDMDGTDQCTSIVSGNEFGGTFTVTYEYSPYACSNGLDDDGDGDVDYPDDPGCADAADDSERESTLPCDNGLDDDGDGRADFDPVTYADAPDFLAGTGDPGCAAPEWPIEDPQCQDGVNNDSGPNIDFDGGQSIHGQCTGVPGGCPAGVTDPDGDGVADPDDQCVGRPWKDKEKKECGLGPELALLLPLLMGLRRRRGARRRAAP